MAGEETERICFNCIHFFPASERMTEYGACLVDKDFDPYLVDKDFDPYIEALLENFNFASCQDLIDKIAELSEVAFNNTTKQ